MESILSHMLMGYSSMDGRADMTPDERHIAIRALAKTVYNAKVTAYTDRYGRSGLSLTTGISKAEWMIFEAQRRGLPRPDQKDNHDGTVTLYWLD